MHHTIKYLMESGSSSESCAVRQALKERYAYLERAQVSTRQRQQARNNNGELACRSLREKRCCRSAKCYGAKKIDSMIAARLVEEFLQR